jgi:uncharacterized protein YqjF (DUF2071 family)
MGQPEAPVFLTAGWHWLLMLSFAVDPALLRRHVPRGVEVDDWRGTTLLSLVGLRFVGTRVLGCAVPFHRDFDEINLRFYVRARGPEGWRRGVVFIREVVARRAVASVARWLYGERYVVCPTRSAVVEPREGRVGSIAYRWRARGRWLSIGAAFAGTPAVPGAGSEEEFVTEHPWGYSGTPDGPTLEYRVEHPPWRVWPALRPTLEGDLTRFYGAELGEALRGAPRSAFVADGSPVVVRRGVRVTPSP